MRIPSLEKRPGSDYHLDLDYRGILVYSPDNAIEKVFRREPEDAELDKQNALKYLQGWTAGIIVDHSVGDYILLKNTEPTKRAELIVTKKILLPPFED
jgi:hypothetical protein